MNVKLYTTQRNLDTERDIPLLLKLRDDIRRAMNKSEVTLAILIDYSKAFDKIDYKKLLLKLNQMGFSKKSIEVIHSYITERNQFVQIDDKVSNLAHIYFGLPQGSIIGPVLLNLYVIDAADILRSHSVQYINDKTLYEHSKVKNISVSRLEEDLRRLSNWFKDQNLVFNDSKTKLLLFSTSQMSLKHNLSDTNICQVKCNNITSEGAYTTNVLGVHLNQHLNWNDHVTYLVKSTCGFLRTFRLFKDLHLLKYGKTWFTHFNVRKNLAECLVLSKLNYGNVVCAITISIN